MIKLALIPYVFSKFILLGIVGLVQVAIMYYLTAIGVGLSGPAHGYLFVLGGTILAATALGLWISAIVKSSEAAMALVPVIIIFHILLSGYLKPLKNDDRDWVSYIAAPFISRWSTEALLEVERIGLRYEDGGSRALFAHETKTDEIEDAVLSVSAAANLGPKAEVWRKQEMEAKGLTASRLPRDLWSISGFLAVFSLMTLAALRIRDTR